MTLRMVAAAGIVVLLLPPAPAMSEANTQSAAVPDPRLQQVIALMGDFAQRTGLASSRPPRRERLLARLLADALTGLRHYAQSGELQTSAEHRLAFRELGLAIGLDAVRRLQESAAKGRTALGAGVRAQLEELMVDYEPLGEGIESFWRDPAHRAARSWSEHRDINEVMLATRLAPEGFLLWAPLH